MSYKIIAYTFLKILYDEHVKTRGAICRFDFDKLRERSGVNEPDGILELVITFLRGKNLIHVSYPNALHSAKTYYISLYGVKCVSEFECSEEYDRNSESRRLVTVNYGGVRNETSVMIDEPITEALCQAFFLKV